MNRPAGCRPGRASRSARCVIALRHTNETAHGRWRTARRGVRCGIPFAQTPNSSVAPSHMMYKFTARPLNTPAITAKMPHQIQVHEPVNRKTRGELMIPKQLENQPNIDKFYEEFSTCIYVDTFLKKLMNQNQ